MFHCSLPIEERCIAVSVIRCYRLPRLSFANLLIVLILESVSLSMEIRSWSLPTPVIPDRFFSSLSSLLSLPLSLPYHWPRVRWFLLPIPVNQFVNITLFQVLSLSSLLFSYLASVDIFSISPFFYLYHFCLFFLDLFSISSLFLLSTRIVVSAWSI